VTKKQLIAFSALMTLCLQGCADDITPSEILELAEAAYKSMDTYKAEGTVTSDIDTGGMKVNAETSFSMVLKKPNLYLITWAQTNSAMPSMSQSGAVWSDGDQPYLYMGRMNTYSKMGSDDAALGGAAGMSGGAVVTVPSLFLSTFDEQPGPFARLIEPQIEKTEKIEGEDCYVVSGSSSISKEESFWISKKSFVIKKHHRSLEAPEGGMAIPEMTDEQLDAAVRAMGQEVTEESRKNMAEMVKASRSMVKNMDMKGSSTEVHTDISSPELSKIAFKYSPPEGAVLKESLFGGKNQ